MRNYDENLPPDTYSEPLIEALRQAKHIVVFSGAGISAESGIPTFRDKMTGLWANFSAEMLATRMSFRRDPALVWGWYEWRRRLIMEVQPNPAHLAVAKLAKRVPQITVITQNVDDLHERAGSEDVIHLHGSLLTARCFACERPYPLSSCNDLPVTDQAQCQEPPRCGRCNGRVRPGVVWFGENLPQQDFGRALKTVRACDVLISVGTSSKIFPAAALPFEAVKRKATVIQVNLEETELDRVADFNIHGPAGVVLRDLVQSVWPD